jgi:hypothetical protein
VGHFILDYSSSELVWFGARFSRSNRF